MHDLLIRSVDLVVESVMDLVRMRDKSGPIVTRDKAERMLVAGIRSMVYHHAMCTLNGRKDTKLFDAWVALDHEFVNLLTGVDLAMAAHADVPWCADNFLTVSEAGPRNAEV